MNEIDYASMNYSPLLSGASASPKLDGVPRVEKFKF